MEMVLVSSRYGVTCYGFTDYQLSQNRELTCTLRSFITRPFAVYIYMCVCVCVCVSV